MFTGTTIPLWSRLNLLKRQQPVKLQWTNSPRRRGHTGFIHIECHTCIATIDLARGGLRRGARWKNIHPAFVPSALDFIGASSPLGNFCGLSSAEA